LHKTVFVDGSEVGKSRFDVIFKKQFWKRLMKTMENKQRDAWKMWLRTFVEKNRIVEGIEPLPMLSTNVWWEKVTQNLEKDIDFFCVWGQDEFPILRREVRGISFLFVKKMVLPVLLIKSEEHFMKN